MEPKDLKPDWDRVSTSTGYPVVYCPEHPRSWSTGYVYVHVLLKERDLGRFLKRGEIVHHDDENKLNYSIDNLILRSKSLHAREHGLSRGEQMAVLRCPACLRVFERPRRLTFLVSGRGTFTCCSSHCRGVFSRMVQDGDARVVDRVLSNVIKTYKKIKRP